MRAFSQRLILIVNTLIILKKNYTEALQQNKDDFKRDTGVSPENFTQIIKLVKDYLDDYFVKYPNKTKGIKPSISIEDKVLLTLYYLRHYPTFQNLGDNFEISESYANKIYHKMMNIIVEVLHVEGHKTLMDKDIDVVVVDVCEQPIERPVKGQKKYYSGKKKTYH